MNVNVKVNMDVNVDVDVDVDVDVNMDVDISQPDRSNVSTTSQLLLWFSSLSVPQVG